MATTASGLTIPGSSPTTTAATPIQDHWNNLGKSLNGRIVVPVASVTARAALVSALTAEGYTISASNPLIVFRADAIPGFQTEVTTDGSTFAPIGGAGATMGTPTRTALQGTSTSAATETRDAILGNYMFTAVAGHMYRACIEGMQVQATSASDLVTLRLRNGGATTPTATSTLVASTQVWVPGTGFGVGVALSDTFAPGAGTVTLGLFLIRVAGTGTDQAVSNRSLYATDLGPA